jgi:hypothetical protein
MGSQAVHAYCSPSGLAMARLSMQSPAVHMLCPTRETTPTAAVFSTANIPLGGARGVSEERGTRLPGGPLSPSSCATRFRRQVRVRSGLNVLQERLLCCAGGFDDVHCHQGSPASVLLPLGDRHGCHPPLLHHLWPPFQRAPLDCFCHQRATGLDTSSISE